MSETGWMEGLESGWGVDMEEAGRVRCPTQNSRFWMPTGSEKTIVFLSAKPSLAFWEHSMKIGKSYRNFATCLAHDKMECILCALDSRVQKYKAVPFSIIDRSEYETKHGEKAGTKVKDTRRILVAKNQSWEKIARKAKKLEEDGNSLRMAEFRVYRSKDSKSPSTGDDFEFLRMVDPAEFEDTTEFDYNELFKPNPELVEKYVLQMKTLVGGGSEGGEAASDASVSW